MSHKEKEPPPLPMTKLDNLSVGGISKAIMEGEGARYVKVCGVTWRKLAADAKRQREAGSPVDVKGQVIKMHATRDHLPFFVISVYGENNVPGEREGIVMTGEGEAVRRISFPA